MTLTRISLPTILIIATVAVLFLLPTKFEQTTIDFTNYVHADDILKDPDVKFIMQSSLFEGVETSISHSADRHPNDQELKDKCLNGGGMPVMAMFNPKTKHCVEIIQENGGERWLVRVVKQIDGMFNEITAFTDDWTSVQQVENYLNAGGYMHMWP